jgi:DNA-binding phage protein
MMKILEQARQAIRASNKSCYRIAKDTNISKDRLSKLMSGRSGLSFDALEKLVDYLGCEVVIQKKEEAK